jgi:hypothetical protein
MTQIVSQTIPCIYNKNDDKNKLNLIIGVTGSVATIKLKQLVTYLIKYFNIRIVAS